MFPSLYKHWGITLTVIGGGYVLLALLWCRLLGFNRSVGNGERDTPPRPESSARPKKFSDSETIRSPRVSELGDVVRPDCCAQELLYTSAYVQCLTKDNEGCPHRLGYGGVIFCHHPQRKTIVERSNPKDA